MKKLYPIITLLIIFIYIIFNCIFIFSPSILEKIDTNLLLNISSILMMILFPLLLISRSILLIQRDTKINIGKMGLIYSIFYIIISLLIIFKVITDSLGADTIQLICNAFLFLLLTYTFIFETNAINKIVNDYQYLVALITTIAIGYTIFNCFNKDFNILLLIKDFNAIITILLLIISIPIVNILFQSSIKESNSIDMDLQDIRREQEKQILNMVENDIVEEKQNIPINTIIEQKPNPPINSAVDNNQIKENQQPIPDAFDIPIINTPVSINEQKKEESNNTNPSL